MELRLRDHLAKLFNEQKKSKKDVRENHRAMAKLLKEAQRLKTVLSANAEFMAQVNCCVMSLVLTSPLLSLHPFILPSSCPALFLCSLVLCNFSGKDYSEWQALCIRFPYGLGCFQHNWICCYDILQLIGL